MPKLGHTHTHTLLHTYREREREREVEIKVLVSAPFALNDPGGVSILHHTWW